MHWTGMLAYRRWPREARVIDDLPCIACGQNLRSIQVWGRCPECGAEVRESLHVLAKPTVVAGGLATIGKSYLALLALILGCINGWATPWMLIVATAIIAFGSTWRVGAVAVLRYRAAINKLPVIGARLSVLWLCAVADSAASIAWLGASVVIANAPSMRGPGAGQILNTLGVGWTATTFLSATAAGWFGIALATMLGYGWLRIVFKIQLMGVVWAVLTLTLVGLLVIAAAPWWLVVSGLALLAVVCMVAIALTAVSLIQLSNAAYQSDELWDEAVAV